MPLSTYEPAKVEITLTLALGLTLLTPYYRGFVRSLNLCGSERVLDFGSGSGVCSRHIASHLQRNGGHLDCIDISSGWQRVIRRILRRYNNISYHCGRITTLNLPASIYDVVVIHFVLHDIPNAERADIVLSLAQALKPSGRLILREPQYEGLSLEELNQLTMTAGLLPITTNAHKTIVGAVYDACYQYKERKLER